MTVQRVYMKVVFFPFDTRLKIHNYGILHENAKTCRHQSSSSANWNVDMMMKGMLMFLCVLEVGVTGRENESHGVKYRRKWKTHVRQRHARAADSTQSLLSAVCNTVSALSRGKKIHVADKKKKQDYKSCIWKMKKIAAYNLWKMFM